MEMKRNANKILMTLCLSAVSILVMTGCTKNNGYNNPPANNNYTISGNANGSNMVPSVSGNGAGTISGTYNSNTHVMNYTSNWSGLSGNATNGGFFNGAAGSNGAAIGNAWTIDSTSNANHAVSGTMTLTPQQAQQLTSGNMYYTIGTATNPNGEIRGQVTATQQ